MKRFLVLLIISCLFYTTAVYAKVPAEIKNTNTISAQLVDEQKVAAPHMITGESLVGLIKSLVKLEEEKGASVVYHRRTGKLFVKTTPKSQKAIEDILMQLRNYDLRQIMIQARIVEVSSFEGSDIGVDWSNINKSWNNGKNSIKDTSMNFAPGDWGSETLTAANELNLTYGYLNGSTTLDVTLKALEKEGKAKTLSSPNISCLNNQRANIKIETTTDYVSRITTNTVYSGTNVDVHSSADVDSAIEGIVLDVSPSINSDNKSLMIDLHPAVIELVSLSEVTLKNGDSLKVPKYIKRTADTTVYLDDGGTIVIGGLMKSNEKKDIRKVPILGDIPLIKNLFRAETKYDQKSSLMIFITAKINDM